jgi:hypothetical protein
MKGINANPLSTQRLFFTPSVRPPSFTSRGMTPPIPVFGGPKPPGIAFLHTCTSSQPTAPQNLWCTYRTFPLDNRMDPINRPQSLEFLLDDHILLLGRHRVGSLDCVPAILLHSTVNKLPLILLVEVTEPCRFEGIDRPLVRPANAATAGIVGWRTATSSATTLTAVRRASYWVGIGIAFDGGGQGVEQAFRTQNMAAVALSAELEYTFD